MPQNSSLFNGGIIGKDNTPSASDKVTTITSNGCFNRTTATATATLTGDAVSAITVSIGGSGYTSTTPPEVVIQIPNSISDSISGSILLILNSFKYLLLN